MILPTKNSMTAIKFPQSSEIQKHCQFSHHCKSSYCFRIYVVKSELQSFGNVCFFHSFELCLVFDLLTAEVMYQNLGKKLGCIAHLPNCLPTCLFSILSLFLFPDCLQYHTLITLHVQRFTLCSLVAHFFLASVPALVFL